MLIVVPTSSDETATAYCWSLGEYQEGQDGITPDQFNSLADRNDTNTDGVAKMTACERYQFLLEEIGYYTFDQLVVIDDKHLPTLDILSDMALSHGSDSPLYDACEMYNASVRALREKTIPFFNEYVYDCDF